MGKIFAGIDVAAIINDAVGGQLNDSDFNATLVKRTAGTPTTGESTGGVNPTPTSYTAKGFLEAYSEGQIDGTRVTVNDRLITLLGDSIAGGQVPEQDDSITIEGTTFRVVRVARDPVDATYECQGRGR